MKPRHFDLVISGNGPVGCTLSLYLSKLFSSKDLRKLTESSNFLILEKQKRDSAFPPDFPTRNFSLTNSNLSFLDSLFDQTHKNHFRESGNYFRGMQIWKQNCPGIVKFGQKGGYLDNHEKYQLSQTAFKPKTGRRVRNVYRPWQTPNGAPIRSGLDSFRTGIPIGNCGDSRDSPARDVESQIG